MVYYTATKVDFHAPEACLAGQGIQMSKSKQVIDIDYKGERIPLDVVQLIRKEGMQDTLIFYFYKAGDFIGDNYINLRLNLVKNKFSNTKKSGSLIRFSTPISQDRDNSTELLKEFIEEIYPYIVNSL